MFLLIFLLFLSSFRDAQQEKHFLHYKFTALTKADTFPEFSAVGVCDDRQIKHCKDRLWVRESLTVDNWTKSPANPPDHRDWFIHQLYSLSNCTNSQCSELHVLQRIIGCELEKLPDGTVNLTVFDEYGFDGEDFISFSDDTMQWIDKSPKAKETVKEWNNQIERNQYIKGYLENCVHTISTFNHTNMSAPDVRVSARKSPDDDSNLILTCLATGFYPRDVQMNIRLDKTKLEDQTSSGIRPNEDETFQMRISVKIDRNHEGSYDCLVIHSSLTVTVEWDGKCSNCEPEPQRGVIYGIIAAVVVFVIGCYIYKRKSSNGLMTWRRNYGSMDGQSQNDL
ncbi:major histocompatibility complex class I-related gene protein-like isoform X2 [Ctenopharyngodon idella]|uniref:major histocompatibility complex class I-related gene protein-like isoform X2 n=1 Tax=Ctenopharyngodon idella TaxID=7959 RepID=UPI002231A69B|nr:major histocompatibility complex class I-related gene protein-like isoform X2 [Ctenopharyngodon idella]